MEKFEDIGCTKLRKDDRSLAVAGGRWQTDAVEVGGTRVGQLLVYYSVFIWVVDCRRRSLLDNIGR
jgi:hypothetical protein